MFQPGTRQGGKVLSPRASLAQRKRKTAVDPQEKRDASPGYSSGGSRHDTPTRGSGISVFPQKSPRRHRAHRQQDLAKKLMMIKNEANFLKEQHFVRDGVPLYLYVKHQGFDRAGRLLPSDGTAFPGENQRKTTNTGGMNTSAFVRRRDVDVDPADASSSSVDDDSINYEDDAEDSRKVHLHVFTVDLVLRYPDVKDEIMLHWGISRKQEGAWGSPDPKFLPPNSQQWSDGLAYQSQFIKEKENPSIRTVRIVFKWTDEVEPPVTSMSFVFMERFKKVWSSINGRDKVIVFCPFKQIEQHVDLSNMPRSGEGRDMPQGPIRDAVQAIIDAEVHKNSWTLMHRYFLCRDLLKSGKVEARNRDHVAYIFIWLRYSFMRQLAWQRHYNTKPRELQHAQVCLVEEFCQQYKASIGHHSGDSFLSAAEVIRATIGLVGKGSGNGQQVRDEILHIMHRHKIKESQRRDNSGAFYEQWHQKLHNNTTPDDIPICEALLAFLRTNKMSEYWRVLSEAGITKERLASYERNITWEPSYIPASIPCFENYLLILKKMHSSDDLNILLDEARGHVGGDTHRLMDDLKSNVQDHDTLRQMERVLTLRKNLVHNHYDRNNTHKLKDIIFLDLCLESYTRQLTERIMHIDIGFEQYVREAGILMDNLVLSYGRQWTELQYCKDDLKVLVQNEISKRPGGRLTEDAARKMKSVIDRMKGALAEVNEVIDRVMQGKAELMGGAFRVDEFAMKLFAEEVLRGTLFFSLSMIIKKIDPLVRKSAHLGDWLIVSPGRSHGSRGFVERVHKLEDVMYKKYEQRTVLLVDKVSGEEEVPENVQAIVMMNSSDYPDVLAHVSVRARNLKVLLAVLFNESSCRDLDRMAGEHLVLNVKNGAVEWERVNPDKPVARKASSHMILQEAVESAQNLPVPPMFRKSLMLMDEFSSKHSGAKSNNLKSLRVKLDWSEQSSTVLEGPIRLPESACVPFQMAEYTIGLDPQANAKYQSILEKLLIVKSVKKMEKMLFQSKDLIMGLNFHPDDQHHRFLKEQLVNFGVPSDQFEEAWTAIKKVWASKFNERAFLATQKLGVRIDQIFMAVLVQRVIPADYAFVVHTVNPMTQNESEVYCEACIGLGEALVSDMPGQALSFTYDKVTKRSKLNSYPNKPMGLIAEGFIFRSDSNSEDLPGFAGAGLFDSYTMHEQTHFRINYNQEKLLVDEQFRETFMSSVGYIGELVEKVHLDDPQDIEGVFFENEFYVVQTRPQV